MNDSPIWSTEWSRRRAARQSDLFDPTQIKRDARDVLIKLLTCTLSGPKPPQLRAEFIASKRQSACLVERTGEAAILFDLTQSIVLKRLFRVVHTDQPYDEAARILGAAAGLAISDQGPALCSALMSIKVPEQSEYLHEQADLLEYYKVLKQVLQLLLVPWQSSMIDGYLFAHEVSHFVFQRPDKLMTRVQSGARSAFDFALNQVCYEQQPEFEDIAQYWGALPKEPEALDRLRRDLANRRTNYETNRDHIVEEITCDAYAFVMLMASHLQAWRADTDDHGAVLEGYMRFAQTFFLILSLFDLHQAMIKRAKLSVATGIESEKPGDIADMHFRKMALIYAIAEGAMTCMPPSEQNNQTFTHLLAKIVEIIGAQKQAFDSLFVIPVTRVIRAQIVAFEQRPREPQFAEATEPWRGRLGALFGYQLSAATFQEEAMRSISGI